ncbi:unnamed protein product, partial [Hapterophycus canaliculatus]
MPAQLSFQTKNWLCPLACQRCESLNANGRRCMKRVCFGTPFCWMHNSAKFGVQSKTSTIPNAGRGLFATRKLEKDSWICPYVGESTTMKCIKKRYPGDMTSPYTEQIPVDSACRRGIGSLANGRFNADGTVSHLNQHNCISRLRPKGDGFPGLWLKTTKIIKAGDEIFHWYGEGGYLLQDCRTTRPGGAKRCQIPDL